MKVTVKDTFVILEDEYNDVVDFAKYLTHKIPASFPTKNIIVNLLQYSTMQLEELLQYEIISNNHREKKHSFVIVNNALNPDDLPDEIIVVPTIQEGEDIIEMEEIERDLGF